MKKKKFISVLSVFLVVTLLLTGMPVRISAAEIIASGDCEHTLTYTFDSDGVLTISGDGIIYHSSSHVWDSFRSKIKTIIIENGVTYIGQEAFKGCSSLQRVVLADSVTEIGYGAFRYCSRLTDITVGDSISRICEYAFSGTGYFNTSSNWTNGILYLGAYLIRANTDTVSGAVTVKKGTKCIADSAFSECKEITAITVPESVVSIGSYVFRYCTELSDVTVPDSVVRFGYNDFYGTAYYNNEINWSDGILYLGNRLVYADKNKTGTSCIIKAGTKRIENSAFSSCSALTDISIPDSVTYVGEYAFSYCSATVISLPDSITVIDDFAFEYCDKLQNIILSNRLSSIGNSVFYGCSALKSIDIPTGVTSLGDSVFFGCSSLQSIGIPAGITSFGDSLFSGCSSLKSIDIPADIISLGNDVFSGCSSLQSIGIPAGITSFGDRLFSGCSSLKSIDIPANIISLGNAVFSGCSSLQSIDIPAGITSFGDRLFSGCSSLKSIDIPADIISLGNAVFSGCSSLQSIDIPAGITVLSDYICSGCTALTDVNLPAGLLSIGSRAFSECTGLTDFSIPEHVESIGVGAFSGCIGLTAITIPDSVTSLGREAFNDCTGLTSIIIGSGISTINSFSFSDCDALSTVIIPETVTSIHSYAFDNCDSLTTIYIPPTVTNIENDVFRRCRFDALIICGKLGSEAETYAHENDIVFRDSAGYISSNINNIDLKNSYLYSDDYFSLASDAYHHDFAKFALNVTTAVAVNEGDYSVVPAYAKSFFKEIGFGDDEGEFFEAYGYDVKETDSIACCIASKNIADKDETLIILGVRGAGYEWEWGGNFNVGQSGDHTGFTIAAKTVRDRLYAFIGNHTNDFNANVKILLTGYSRAAATANLVGSYLDNEIDNAAGSSAFFTGLVQEKGFGKANLYVYTFETPRNTTDTDSHNNKYNNIFNIVNPIDIVPKVAMAAWGFTRYGTDCYLPSAETSGSKYAGYLAKMSKQYKTISGGYSYKEDFTFYEMELGTDNVLGLKILPKVKWKENKSIGQGHFCDGLLRILASDIIGSRYTYATKYQHTTELIVPSFLCGDGTSIGNLISDIKTIIANSLAVSVSTIDVRAEIAQALVENIDADNPNFPGGISYEEAYELVGEVDDILVGLVQHPNYLYTAIEAFGEKHKYAASDILMMLPHSSQVTTAWMETVTASDIKFDTAGYRVVKYDCPVDISVYDEAGTLCARIVNDEPQEIENGYIAAYIDDNGSKCFCLPTDCEYSFEITGTDSGTMNCTVCDFDYEAMDNVYTEMYYDIPVAKDVTYTAVLVESENAQEKSDFILTDEKDTVIQSNAVYEQDEIPVYTVTAVSGGASSLLGGGTFSEGEFAQLTAIPGTGERFTGWYIGEEKVSDELIYRFCVKNDVRIEARFEEISIVYGDINGEDGVTAADARLALRASVKLETLTEEQTIAADVDGNGELTAADARLILRYSVKLETGFPAEE